MVLLETFLLTFTTSIDTFIAGFSYGVNRIKIPVISYLITSFISTFILVGTIAIGKLISPLIDNNISNLVGFFILLSLGIYKVIECIKKYYRSKKKKKKFHYKFDKFELVLMIYDNPETADIDHSKCLSIRETLLLTIAISLDNIALGIGISFFHTPILLITISLLVIGIAMLWIGNILGKKISNIFKFDGGIIGGILLIILALLKL